MSQIIIDEQINLKRVLESIRSMNDLLENYPKLSREAIQEAVELASQALVRPFEPGQDRKLWLPA